MKTSRSAIRTAATGTGPVASFVRFVVFGGGTGVAASGVLVVLTAYFSISLAIANAAVTVVSTIAANELHSRMTFRSDRRGWRMHLQSSGTAAVSYLFTTGAMLALHATAGSPGVMTEQAVYLTASGLAGIGRFAALRVYVFARGIGGTKTAATARTLTPAIDRGTVTVAA